MPKLLKARLPSDLEVERWLRKLARSKRAPAEQVLRARTIVMSWDGAETAAIATGLGCHPQTVRERIARFNADGAASIVSVSGGGRRPRLTESQRRQLVALVERLAGGELPDDVDLPFSTPSRNATIAVRRPFKASLDVLVAAARGLGIEIGRSQLRRVLLAAGLRWHPTHSWAPAGHALPREHAKSAEADHERLPAGASAGRSR